MLYIAEGGAMMLEHMVCSECGEVFDDDLFAENPSDKFVCPMCGTVTLDAEPVEDRVLHVHFAATTKAESPVLRLSA
jgi:hypothetical protein